MAIKFSVARRGLLPSEEARQESVEGVNLQSLRPQLLCSQTVDVVRFQSGSSRLPSLMPKGELQAALSTVASVMLHELEKGNAVSLPGIGIFRLRLEGGIEVKDGNLHGKDVRVDGLQFRPDRELLSKVRGFEVEQVPYGTGFRAEDEDVEARLEELLASKSVITHKDVAFAFEHLLTRGRITNLLNRLVAQGRLVREGKGSQTVYRKA